MDFDLGILTASVYILAFISAVLALWRARTPQGATAWVVGLLSFPFIALPLFLIFGRNKFFGYVKERKQLDSEAQKLTGEIENLYDMQVEPGSLLSSLSILTGKGQQPGFLPGNEMELLIDAEAAYESMLHSIERAQKYILFQFYIFRTDASGQRFAEVLKRKSKEGVKVYFLYDEIGKRIPKRFLRDLREAGIQAEVFLSTKGWNTGLQVNFRNHRKIVVVDGEVVFLGGINIGEDYLGKWPSIGSWRDTHVRICGPAAVSAQISFVKDWYWATEEIPSLDWAPKIEKKGADVLVLHTGPADDPNLCLLSHLALINAAQKRIWISNPYFVPPEPIEAALALAALRGVDVRVMTPLMGDNPLVTYAAEVYEARMMKAGVKMFKYLSGYNHQKVMLVDECAGVGSTNFDSRSFFINFEVMALSSDPAFVRDVELMLEEDFKQSRELLVSEFINRPLWKSMRSRAAALLSPIL